jgi:hypothetical protein
VLNLSVCMFKYSIFNSLKKKLADDGRIVLNNVRVGTILCLLCTMYMMTVLSFTEVPCYFKIYHRLDNNLDSNITSLFPFVKKTQNYFFVLSH